jgi:hypothetical protein
MQKGKKRKKMLFPAKTPQYHDEFLINAKKVNVKKEHPPNKKNNSNPQKCRYNTKR